MSRRMKGVEALECLAANSRQRLRLQERTVLLLPWAPGVCLPTHFSSEPAPLPKSASSPLTGSPANQYSYRPPPHLQPLVQWDTHTLFSHSRMPIPIFVLPRPTFRIVSVSSLSPLLSSFPYSCISAINVLVFSLFFFLFFSLLFSCFSSLACPGKPFQCCRDSDEEKKKKKRNR